MGPKVYNALDGRAGLEDLDGQGNMRNGEALHQVHCELLGHVAQNALLFVQHRLVIAEETAIGLQVQALQNFLFTRRELLQYRILAKVQRCWTLPIHFVAGVCEGEGPCRYLSFPR